jgi:hypothetical protein
MDSKNDILFVVGIILLMVFSWIGKVTSPEDETQTRTTGDGPRSSLVESRSSRTTSRGSANNDEVFIEPYKSQWFEKVDISRGNSGSAFQPSQEYISIRMDNSKLLAPINISGWSVQNGASQRRYQLGDSIFYGTSAKVPIPAASELFIPGALDTLGPIVLKPGEKAVLVTGSMPPVTSFPITSMKLNMCSGYLEEMENVKFSPAVSRDCPDPESYPEVRTFEKSCFDFIRRLNDCHTPKFEDIRRADGGYEVGAVDGILGLSSQCKAFIQTTYNYNSCVAKNITNPEFYKKEWRVFLNQPWELWAKDRETITLYDQYGKVVDQVIY